MLAPIVEKVVKDNNIKLAKVDVDENEGLVGLMYADRNLSSLTNDEL
jgi:hypothetical protein